MPTIDEYDLRRFLTAQAPVYSRALAELVAGRKRSHWMWFIFPQLRGLGSSALADLYGINSVGEAGAYLDHPILGERLRQCTRAVLDLEGASLSAIFDSPDDMKFRSSMTLFALAAGDDENLFREALAKYCLGRADQRTLALIGEPEQFASKPSQV
jgi:uncharacterized protein (DUF1810 family)